MDCFLLRNMDSNLLLLEQYITWEAAVQMSCKFTVFMPVSSDQPIQGEVQILFIEILIILLLFYYAKAFTNTRTVSLDVLLGNVVEGIAELFEFY